MDNAQVEDLLIDGDVELPKKIFDIFERHPPRIAAGRRLVQVAVL